MTRATIEREIARLDAIGRQRALDPGETIQLDRLIRAERTNDRQRRASAAAAARQSQRTGRSTIAERLDDTIARMAREQLSVRAIYLNDRDLAALEADCPAGPGGDRRFRGHPVRRTKAAQDRSCIYSTHGIARSVRSSR